LQIYDYIALAILAALLVIAIVLLLRRRAPDEAAITRAVENAVRLANRELGHEITESSSRETVASREEVGGRVDRLRDTMTAQLERQSASTATGLDAMRNKVDERLDKIQQEMRQSLTSMQSSNEKKLDEMRRTVDEKLEKTLETRLQKSFETVSLQLESVNRGLGEMKSVADSVGALNKVLSGSKTRGILGELQLRQIIEDMLSDRLYECEIPTIPGSADRVEFAIRLPGADADGTVYLPIDSKFPLEDYYRLLDGYESGDSTVIDASRKALLARVKQFAKDVRRKYVSPPHTTPFAVIFLPTEGLYAEVVRDSSFFDGLRQDGVIVAGPTTLSAMLSSLQVGFKTLQIQRGAAEIEKTLGAVKKEFENFESVLTKAHDKITQAGAEIDNLVGTRTRAINRTLREVQTYDGKLSIDNGQLTMDN
jgi:DNA recombination protein RmuC